MPLAGVADNQFWSVINVKLPGPLPAFIKVVVPVCGVALPALPDSVAPGDPKLRLVRPCVTMMESDTVTGAHAGLQRTTRALDKFPASQLGGIHRDVEKPPGDCDTASAVKYALPWVTADGDAGRVSSQLQDARTNICLLAPPGQGPWQDSVSP